MIEYRISETGIPVILIDRSIYIREMDRVICFAASQSTEAELLGRSWRSGASRPEPELLRKDR